MFKHYFVPLFRKKSCSKEYVRYFKTHILVCTKLEDRWEEGVLVPDGVAISHSFRHHNQELIQLNGSILVLQHYITLYLDLVCVIQNWDRMEKNWYWIYKSVIFLASNIIKPYPLLQS
jgi:hypothetical protein